MRRALRRLWLRWRIANVADELKRTHLELRCVALLEPEERAVLYATVGALRLERDSLLTRIAETRL